MEDRKNVLANFEKYAGYTEDTVKTGIEKNRKAYAEITVKNKEGNPVSNVTVNVEQKEHAFKYGANIFMLDELETAEKNEAYKKYFADAFNMATLPFYWDDLEPEKGKQRYSAGSPKIYRRPPIDLCLDFCRKNNIEPREHALAYDHFFPDWLAGKSVTEVKFELERRFSEIAERYADKIHTIEVTNEMMWDVGKTKFYRADDYLEWCYKTAEKYFPNNQLVINEWSGLWYNTWEKLSPYYMMIENTILKGGRIDAIGMQYHMFQKREDEKNNVQKSYNPVNLYSILDTYAGLNRPIQITEVTVPAYSNDSADEEIQAQIIENLYSIWFSHANVEQIIYWNLVDGYAAFAPQGDMTSGENYYYGGLLRFDMTPKPSYYTIKNLFQKKWHTSETITTGSDGSAVFKGFKGKYEVTVLADGKKISKTADFSSSDAMHNKLEIEI